MPNSTTTCTFGGPKCTGAVPGTVANCATTNNNFLWSTSTCFVQYSTNIQTIQSSTSSIQFVSIPNSDLFNSVIVFLISFSLAVWIFKKRN